MVPAAAGVVKLLSGEDATAEREIHALLDCADGRKVPPVGGKERREAPPGMLTEGPRGTFYRTYRCGVVSQPRFMRAMSVERRCSRYHQTIMKMIATITAE